MSDRAGSARSSRSLAGNSEASPWTVAPSDSPLASFARQERQHEAVIGDRMDEPSPNAGRTGVRRLVRESWQRSLSLRLDPLTAQAAPTLTSDELDRLRAAHPLAAV
ncbi:MAG: hypothetical protein ABWY68_08810, partial [Cryobacterium sp.]